MHFINFSKRVFINFLIVAGACLIATTLYSTLFITDLNFNVLDLWMVLLMAFLSSLTIFVYYSNHEISKKSMKWRRIIQFILVLVSIFGVAFYNNWIEIDHFEQVLIMFVLIVIVTVGVGLYNFRMDAVEAQRLNKALEKFREEDE
ncbi:MAG TPA: DUF3021 family protein [Lachnospiraceae bacterium]|nr:DUF3021 family protein [Lachnospiraceae bacterium]